MLMKKRPFAILCSAVILCFLLTGCDNPSRNSTSGNPSTPADTESHSSDNTENTLADSAENQTDIPAEYLTENLDDNYTVNEDGTYNCNGRTFQYKLALASEPSAKNGEKTVYIVLTDNANLTAEEVFRDGIISSTSKTIDEVDFVLLGLHTY